MDTERQLIFNALNAKDTRLYFYATRKRISKSTVLSAESRREAEVRFDTVKHNTKNHAHMLNNYSLAISYGPLDSEELALAYYKRSMFLLHLRKFDEALNDTERAILITKSHSLKVRLYCTQTYCYSDLERPEQKATFEKAKFLFNKFDGSEKEKIELKIVLDDLDKIVGYGYPAYTRSTEKSKGINIDEILSMKEVENPLKSLQIKDNEKDGRHLVAGRNIKAGEIISVMKPYAINSNTELVPYIFCCHCLKIKWDSIPCNICGWCFFCSEKCRDEAWEQYHDMECAVMPMIRHTAEHQHLRQLAVRTIIIAVKQAGGISQLRKELEEVDKCSDTRTKGFSKNGKFENDKFISIYSLISRRSPNLAKVHVNDAAKILIVFAKSTHLFGSVNKFKVISDLVADKDVLFIGSLLLRLFGILSVNYQEVWEKNPLCSVKYDNKLCFKERCCYRASMISPLFSLINHSCNPNATVLYTDANKLMLVALKPIKKNNQIHQAYGGCGFYFEEKKSTRQWLCNNAYNFTCECEACINNWPLLTKLDGEKLLTNVPKSHKLVGEKEKKINELLTSIKDHTIQYNEKTLRDLANAVEIATKNYAEPSFTINTLVSTLAITYRKLFMKKLRYPQYCEYY